MMAPLKYDVCRGLRGTAGEQHPHGEGDGTILTKMRICVPPVWCLVGEELGFGPLWKGVLVLDYLTHSEGVSCNTSSHIWCSRYFPRFLLRGWSFTQMHIASFMVLVTPCDSLSTMLKHSKFTGCSVV